MIEKEKAREILKNYLDKHSIEYTRISNKVEFQEEEIPYGKYTDQVKKTYSLAYFYEGYQNEILIEIVIDAETGEMLFGLSPTSYLDFYPE